MSGRGFTLEPVAATCPACGHHVALPFFAGGDQPLASLAWPKSSAAAQAMKKLPNDFLRCADCGHVFNPAFDYGEVPYAEKPNLMFNRGRLWSHFIRELQSDLLARLPDRPTVLEIGHGDGSFIAALATARPQGRYVGFDPHGTQTANELVEFRNGLFEPSRHIAELKPDLIVSRHVLEHLGNPLGFLQLVAYAASAASRPVACYLEVPCIDRAIANRRTVDFYYEHNSQFTTESFERMLARAGAKVERIGYGYDSEIIFAFLRFEPAAAHRDRQAAAAGFRAATSAAKPQIEAQLAELLARGLSIAIWGGTGKSAAFVNRHGLDAVRFPTVVDSDPDKAGSFVPGTGQEIRPRDWLLSHPVDIVIVPPQWRAHDIAAEMAQAGIRCRQMLIEHDGRLIDFARDPHPYRAKGA